MACHPAEAISHCVEHGPVPVSWLGRHGHGPRPQGPPGEAAAADRLARLDSHGASTGLARDSGGPGPGYRAASDSRAGTPVAGPGWTYDWTQDLDIIKQGHGPFVFEGCPAIINDRYLFNFVCFQLIIG